MHPVFGKVTAGMEVVDSIGKVKTGRQDRPKNEIKITKAELV
jgi:peptidylprolyl isomerase